MHISLISSAPAIGAVRCHTRLVTYLREDVDGHNSSAGVIFIIPHVERECVESSAPRYVVNQGARPRNTATIVRLTNLGIVLQLGTRKMKHMPLNKEVVNIQCRHDLSIRKQTKN